MNCLADVSQRLQNALDSNYNVIDMSTVLEVITVLEGTTITKEQLETTRLAKYINQLRRKTSNDQLARRSKNLLKKWREMVIPNQNTVVQPQLTANTPLNHPSSAISPKSISISNQPSNRLVGNTSLSNGGTPTTQHLWSSLPQNVKGGVLSKENMIRRPMPTTPQQSSVQHKSSSMPMTSTTTPKFPPPILNTNNGSNSSLAASHASLTNTATINSTKLTSRLPSAQPISFANLISQAEINQHIDGPNKVNLNTHSSNRNINKIDITSHLSQSPKMPKIPRRNNVSGASGENNRSVSPPFLMGNRTSNFRLPPHNDIDDANSRPSFTNIEHQSKPDQPNNSRKTLNGFGNMFMSNAKVSSVPTVLFPASDIHDSHSDSSSMIMAPVASASLPVTAITASAISNEIIDSQKHKKRKRQEKNKERNSNRMKDVTSLGGASFDNSISNSSSLGMFNSTTNTTNTTNLVSTTPSNHKLSELTFTGKFSKSDDAIINIDTTSGSSSPKQMIGVRTNSPMLMQDSQCDSPMLSVENSNESETGDSLLKSSNNLLATTTAPIAAVPLDTLDTSRLESSNMPIPKKRGRKKGSTGVDRNMSLAGPSTNQPIFGSVSVLKSKMDSMRSVKKVKTTKELLAELQNRKPALTGNGSGSTNSSPMLELPLQSLVSPSSLCSDNSQTNSTDMRSTTATPVSLQTAPTPEPHTDSHTNIDQPKKQAKMREQQKAIDDEILELRRQLQPIDFDAVNNWTDHDGDTVCTCKLIELDPPLPQTTALNTFDGNMVEGDEKVLQIEVRLTKIDEQLPKVPPDLSDAMQIGKSIKPPIQIQSQQKPPRMKSIFDLDFDDDDDPIHQYTANSEEIKAETVENASAVKLIDSSNSNSLPPQPSSLKENQICNTEKQTTNELSVPCLPPPPIPVNEPTICQRFEVREDPLCPAKAYFITSKNCVTQYHVDTLHNCFIPNVNGNWSVSESEGVKSESTDNRELEELKFVPKYDHMRLDKIQKNMRDFDIGWYRQRKLRKKFVEKADAVNAQPPDCVNVDQDENGVSNSRLSNSSQTNVVDHITEDGDGRDELNCDLKTSCMDDGNVKDVSRVNELEATDGQSEECVASMDSSRKRKGSKRKSVKYKIRKSSSDFSRDLDGAGGPYDGIGDGIDPKIEAPPTRIILKFSRQVTTDADMEDGDDDDDDDYDESDDDDEDGEETFDECEDEDEIMDDVEDENFIHEKDDLVDYNDQSNCHSNDNIREGISIVQNNNDDDDKFVRNVNLSTDVMDVDHFKLRRFNPDEHNVSPQSLIKFDDHLSPASSHQTSILIPVNHLPIHSLSERFQSHSSELNHNNSHPIGITTTPQSIQCDDSDDDDKTAEQLPLENNEQLASFNNVSNENESGMRPIEGLEFKEWHEVVRVRSYNDELLTILPYVVID